MVHRVIGGGPVGLWAAKQLGDSCIVYEEHPRIGRPEHCTGLLSNRIEGILAIPEELKLNKVTGARFFSKNEEFELTRGKVEATVIDRAGFDSHIERLAIDAGAKIELNTSADAFSFPASEKVIVADGVANRTLPKLGLKLGTLPAVQYIVKTSEPFDTDFVELHFLRSDFFAWVVPEEKNVAKIGLATADHPKELLETFLKNRLKGFVIKEKQGSHVVVGGPLHTCALGNKLLVGDAAGQVKATTGGGIITGMICAEIAAKNVETPEEYDRAWRRKIGKELATAKVIRRVLSRFSEKDYDNLMKFARENLDDLKSHGDMDFHTKAVTEIFKKPRNWPVLAKWVSLYFSP
jgi:digeranylgeranylglycerophospholipid reductase